MRCLAPEVSPERPAAPLLPLDCAVERGSTAPSTFSLQLKHARFEQKIFQVSHLSLVVFPAPKRTAIHRLTHLHSTCRGNRRRIVLEMQARIVPGEVAEFQKLARTSLL